MESRQGSYQHGGGVLLRGMAVLICIGFALWVVFAWTHYAERYAAAMDGWRLGGTHLVEISIVAEDRERLACASNTTFGSVRCGYDQLDRRVETPLESTLSPFNTIKNQLLLGAGMWTQPVLQQELPRGRFTVVCNFHVLGVIRPALRWQENGPFDRVKDSVPAGTLSDCEIPR